MDSDKAMSYIMKRVFVWELASECPKVISSFIKYLVESFKNYADFKSINTKELELYNKVYALVFQEIVKLYFTPFLTYLSKQKNYILKDIKHILCDNLSSMRVLEQNMERIRYFVNSVICVLSKGNKIELPCTFDAKNPLLFTQRVLGVLAVLI